MVVVKALADHANLTTGLAEDLAILATHKMDTWRSVPIATEPTVTVTASEIAPMLGTLPGIGETVGLAPAVLSDVSGTATTMIFTEDGKIRVRNFIQETRGPVGHSLSVSGVTWQ